VEVISYGNKYIFHPVPVLQTDKIHKSRRMKWLSQGLSLKPKKRKCFSSEKHCWYQAVNPLNNRF